MRSDGFISCQTALFFLGEVQTSRRGDKSFLPKLNLKLRIEGKLCKRNSLLLTSLATVDVCNVTLSPRTCQLLLTSIATLSGLLPCRECDRVFEESLGTRPFLALPLFSVIKLSSRPLDIRIREFRITMRLFE